LYGAVGALLFGVFYAGAQWGTSPFTTLFVGSILTALIMFAQINWKKGPFSTF
jgi:hypothetical protein